MVEGVDGLARGLHPQTVCQVEGLNSIIKCGGAIIGGTGGVGQSAGIDHWDRPIIIVDVHGKFGILGMLTMSACLPATTSVVTALSLGRSVSAATAIRPALLLLGEFGVCLLALYSAKLVGLGALPLLLRETPFCLNERVAALTIPLGFRVLISLGKV